MPSSCGAVWGQRIKRDPLAGAARLGGDGRPKPQGGDRLSRRTEQHGDLIRALLVEAPDITPQELKARLVQSGAPLSVAALSCSISVSSRRNGKKRIHRGPPQPTLPAVRRAVIKALLQNQIYERCPHCRMRVRVQRE
jgi:hypothetical protein